MNELGEALGESGLIVRGGLVFSESEEPPPGLSGGPARSAVLVGHGGGSIWPHFANWLDAQECRPENPLDTWSREVLEAIAGRFGARAVFPADKPWLPFQQWAMRAEKLKPSPLGILMHPRFGLWHAYRGALLFDAGIEINVAGNPIHLCDLCAGKDCVNACPAGAVSETDFDAGRCNGWLRSGARGQCRSAGCLARAACPHDAFRYSDEQIAFHAEAHLGALDIR